MDSGGVGRATRDSGIITLSFPENIRSVKKNNTNSKSNREEEDSPRKSPNQSNNPGEEDPVSIKIHER